MRIKAKSSGICPLCSRFIAKNHSWITKLPEAIYPRTDDGRYSLDDGEAYYSSGRRIKRYPRRWCHEACRPRYDQEPRYEAAEIGGGRWET